MSILVGPRPDFSKMELSRLKAVAKALGVEVPAKATKAQLVRILSE